MAKLKVQNGTATLIVGMVASCFDAFHALGERFCLAGYISIPYVAIGLVLGEQQAWNHGIRCDTLAGPTEVPSMGFGRVNMETRLFVDPA